MNTVHPPWWIIAIIILLVLPVAQMPALLASAPQGLPMVRTLVWIYPFYVIVAAYLAYVCWQRRPLVTWILLALLVLTHISIWLLCTARIA